MFFFQHSRQNFCESQVTKIVTIFLFCNRIKDEVISQATLYFKTQYFKTTAGKKAFIYHFRSPDSVLHSSVLTHVPEQSLKGTAATRFDTVKTKFFQNKSFGT